MAIIKCKMCGGDMELSADKTFGTCEYCGSTMTLPKVDDEARAAAFNRGNHFRRIGEFDKALAVYERIVREDENDAEAHWCCALCRFGIEYVEDPATYEYLPTCHRASFDNFLEDVDYLAAVEHSDGITRRQYQKEAAKIAGVQKGILATSQNEEPFDVFICYKETDADGNRTKDSVLAQEIYYQLTNQGYRVFFARITLEDKAGTQYEPYIFAALNSARVMVALGTSEANFNAVWVKNEWSRFLALMKKDRSKLLLPCYRDMDPYDLPEQLSILQSYDMSKIGFMQDLTRGISKVLDAEKQPESARETVVVQNEGGANMTALLKRGNMALEDQEWDKADEFFDRVLDMDAECSEAYFGKYLAKVELRNMQDFRDGNCMNWHTKTEALDILVQERAEACQKLCAQYEVPIYLSSKDIVSIIDRAAVSCQQQLKYMEERIAENRQERAEDRLLTRAQSFARGDFSKALQDTLREINAWEDQKLIQTEDADRHAREEAAETAHTKLKDAQEEIIRRHEEALALYEENVLQVQKARIRQEQEALRKKEEDLQRKIDGVMRQKREAKGELSRLGIFAIKRKNELEYYIEFYDQAISNLEEDLRKLKNGVK